MRGVADTCANVRLLLSDGTLANGVGTGAVTTFRKGAARPTLEVRNLNAAAGGTDGESFRDARQRFAELLLSRERPVTYPDLEAVTKAFEPRVRKVKIVPTLERGPGGLCRVQRITINLDRSSFTSPDEEARILQRELEADLQQRSLLGLKVRVAVEWL